MKSYCPKDRVSVLDDEKVLDRDDDCTIVNVLIII
jgi:hypothetical protein